MTYEIGVINSQWPYKTRWTGITCEANSAQEAEDFAAELGYYRNVDTRVVTKENKDGKTGK